MVAQERQQVPFSHAARSHPPRHPWHTQDTRRILPGTVGTARFSACSHSTPRVQRVPARAVDRASAGLPARGGRCHSMPGGAAGDEQPEQPQQQVMVGNTSRQGQGGDDTEAMLAGSPDAATELAIWLTGRQWVGRLVGYGALAAAAYLGAQAALWPGLWPELCAGSPLDSSSAGAASDGPRIAAGESSVILMALPLHL